MHRTHKIRLNPTPEQANYFLRACGVARLVFNYMLSQYKETKSQKERFDWKKAKIAFNALKYILYPFISDVTKCAAEGAISDCRQAINTYYKAKQKNPKVRFPRFRSRRKAIGSFVIHNDKFRVEGNTVFIPKLGAVNMAEPLRFKGKIVTGRVKEKAGKWYLIVVVEVEKPKAIIHPNLSTGIDFGLTRFATLSNGEVIETQDHFRKSERKLKLLQRGLARKVKQSKNYQKWKKKVARQHERIANQRRDFLHKETIGIIKQYKIICIEDLCLKGLMRTWLAKSFANAGIGIAVEQLEYKSEEFGNVIQRVDRFFPSSKRCHVCLHVNKELDLSDRIWTCPNCQTTHDRDYNAAKNLEMEGLSLLVGSGYVDQTPVEFLTTTQSFGIEQAGDDEAGTFVYICVQKR